MGLLNQRETLSVGSLLHRNERAAEALGAEPCTALHRLDSVQREFGADTN